MADQVPKEFYDAVDRFISLANKLAKEQGDSRVSTVILFAAARFNAYCMLSGNPDVGKNLNAAKARFVGQYREMLDDNVEELLEDRG